MKFSVRTMKPVTSRLPIELDSWDRAYTMARNMLGIGDTSVDITITTPNEATYAIVEITATEMNPIIVIDGVVTKGLDLADFLALAPA